MLQSLFLSIFLNLSVKAVIHGHPHESIIFSTVHAAAVAIFNLVHLFIWSWSIETYIFMNIYSIVYVTIDSYELYGGGDPKSQQILLHHGILFFCCLTIIGSTYMHGLTHSSIYSVGWLPEISTPFLNYNTYLHRERLPHPITVQALSLVVYIITRPILISYTINTIYWKFGMLSPHFIFIAPILLLNYYWTFLLGRKITKNFVTNS